MTQIDVKINIGLTITVIAMLATNLWVTGANGAIEKNNDGPKRNRYLLLDSRIIEDTENAILTVGAVQKDRRNPLFKEDKPWEPRFDNVYCNVIYDEQDKTYKCWYSPFIIDERTTSTPPEKRNPESQNYMSSRPRGREMGVCYAVSKDGIHWQKPELGLVEFGGNKKNNIQMRGQEMRGMFRGPHGAGVFKDLHESDLAKRYKMFFRAEKMAVAFSPDGVHWASPILCREIDAPGDTHNNAFWNPMLCKYVGITRLKTRDNIRLVGRTESPDFVNWTKAEVVLRGPERREQTHDMVVFPTGGVYIGLLGIMEFPKDSNYHVKQHVELAWSPDTVEWHRIQAGTPFIAHSAGGAEKYGTMPYDWGTIFASAPIFLEDEIRIYYGACDWYFFDWRKGYLALGTLRPDGWAGYEQIDGNKPASITTTPVVCTDNELQLCVDVGKKGFAKVTILDKENRKLAQSKLVKKTVTDTEVKWLDGFSLENLKGKDVRLRYELKNAKLYSFNFNAPEQAAVPIADSKEAVEKIVEEILTKQRIAQEAHKQKKLTEQARRSQSAQEQIPGYIAQLKDANASVRSTAADELAKIALRVTNENVLLGAIVPLAKAMSDDDTDVRDESAEALGVIASRIKDGPAVKSAVEALVKGLGDEEAEVREECAEALGRIASRAKDKTVLAPAVKPLIKALQDERRATGDFAARALRDIGTSEAKAVLKAR
ncbi:MAG: HEAT repeat domain-containing protein [Planctomycetes bacterium]|nr:HEAT repeat domain-containing protein [Planctomycetota bacterium]